MYSWIVFLHVVGGFGFVLAHGTAAAVAFRLRRERKLERIQALLDLSGSTLNVLYISLLVLLAGGITAGFMRRWWGHGWIWTALGLLIAITVAMYLRGSSYYTSVRKAAGLEYMVGSKPHPPEPPATPEEIDRLLSSSRPVELALIGGVGLTLILWLMMFKPF